MDRITSFSKRLKEYRSKHDLTLADVEKKTGVPAQTINRYELNQRSPKLDAAIHIAKKLEVNEMWLQGYDVSENIDATIRSADTYSFPIRGEVAAGYETLPDEAFSERIEIPEEWLRGQSPSNFFVLKVKGDSMAPDIVEDDLVLVHIQNTVDSGDIAVAIYDSEYATLKQVKYDRSDPTWLDLIPLNRSYDIRHIQGEADVNQCRILGLVWRLIRDYD